MNYYRKPIDKTVDDVKLKMQIGTLTVKITENINKINDLLEVDKDIKKDVSDNSNSIKNIKNEISDKIDKSNIDNLLSNNYYDKNNINLKFNDLYNKNYLDNKFDNIYDLKQMLIMLTPL